MVGILLIKVYVSMVEFIELDIKGVFLINNFKEVDKRGVFVKTLNIEKLSSINFKDAFLESFYTQSNKNVLRGMHFQIPPFDLQKIVYVSSGLILDVVLDIRPSSITYGKSISIELSAFSQSILIPKGCAHGFLTLSDQATVVYQSTNIYHKNSDKGILWNSFGFDWPINHPVLSDRDASFERFDKIPKFF